MNISIFKEAFFIGFATAFLGTLLSFFAMAYTKKSFSFNFNHWNTIIISEFFTGFLLHIFSEYYGLNKWYCYNGNACQ